MSGVREIEVKKDDEGQRLDRWIKRYAPDIPYVLAQKLIRKGQIRVDGGRVKTDTLLSAGGVVRLPPYIDGDKTGFSKGRSEHNKAKKKLSSQDESFMRGLVIFDDGDIVAINKPPGIAVQGGTNTARHIDGLLDALKDKEGMRPRLVHRLDKDTSGVLLLARSAKVAREMGAAFKSKAIEKLYWALLVGVPEQSEGAIKAPLAKGGGLGREKMHVNDKEGKYALTEYAVVEHALDTASFAVFSPKTGRTHQIRVHAQILGCPILGDGKYGGQDAYIEGVEHSRMLHLHAHSVSFEHPLKKGHRIEISAPLPPEMKKTWKSLGFNSKYKGNPFL